MPVSRSIIGLILLLLANLILAKKLNKLQLTPQKHLLVLYSSSSNDADPIKLNFKIDFTSTQSYLSKEHERAEIYLDKSKKKKISSMMTFHTKNIPKKMNSQGHNIQNQQINGIIGFKAGGDFFKSVKQSLNIQHLKLWFKIYQNVIQILNQKCIHHIFAPFQISVQSSMKTQAISIENLSLSLRFKTHKFLNLIEKKSNPFTLTSQQFRARLNVNLRNQVQTIPLRTLINDKCLKIINSNNYQCDVNSSQTEVNQNLGKDKDDWGLLLFEFDPIVCTEQIAIELKQQNRIDSVGYYSSHLLLIALQIGLVILFKNRYFFEKKISWLVGGRNNLRIR